MVLLKFYETQDLNTDCLPLVQMLIRVILVFCLYLFVQKMEEADSKRSSRHPVPVLSILAKAIGDLATKEKTVYSPVLKKWHPLATSVAVATLHSCFGNEIKQFIAGLTDLTPDAAQVLKAADKLEKDLVNIAVEDSVNIDDDGKLLIREMLPYEAENVMANLVKAWVKERVDRLKGWIDKNLQHEVNFTHAQPFKCSSNDYYNLVLFNPFIVLSIIEYYMVAFHTASSSAIMATTFSVDERYKMHFPW